SSARSSVVWIPPADETWAPKITRLPLPIHGNPRSDGAEPDGIPPRRPGAHVSLQLALRAAAGRRDPAPDREHGHEPRGSRRRRTDRVVAPLVRNRLGRSD